MKLTKFHPNRFVAPRHLTRSKQQRFVLSFPSDGRRLDFGCGEGVFLELLQESGRTGVGVEHTKVLAQQCRAKGVEVHVEDVFHFLRSQKQSFRRHLCESAHRTLSAAQRTPTLPRCTTKGWCTDYCHAEVSRYSRERRAILAKSFSCPTIPAALITRTVPPSWFGTSRGGV